MGQQNRTTLKGYFNTGDIPTEGQFVDLLDSVVLQNELPAGGVTIDDTTPSTAKAYSSSRTEERLTTKADLVSGKVALYQLPDTILGQLQYQDVYNATTNTPALPPASSSKGYYWVVNVAGTQQGLDLSVGDWIISNGNIYSKVDNTDAVMSVFGRLGPITAQTGDYTAAQITETSTHKIMSADERLKLSGLPDNTALQTELDGKLDSTPLLRTGTAIAFDSLAVYGSVATPETSNISFNLTGYVPLLPVMVLHQSDSAPTFAVEGRVVYGEYITGILNRIVLQAISSSKVDIYIYNEGAADIDSGALIELDGRDIDGNGGNNAAYADNATVTTWTTKIGSVSATEATAANKPVKLGNGVKFTNSADANNDKLTTGAIAGLTGASQSFAVVFNVTALPAALAYIMMSSYASGATTSAANENFLALFINTTGVNFAGRKADGTFINTATVPITAGKNVLAICVLASNKLNIYVNYMDIPVSNTGVDGVPTTHVKTVLGNGGSPVNNAVANGFSGTIKYFKAWPEALSAAKIAALQTKLGKAFPL